MPSSWSRPRASRSRWGWASWPYLSFGASPRASINLILAGRALAFCAGATTRCRNDIRDLAPDVIRHRLVLSYEALAENISADDLLERIFAGAAPGGSPA
jgi:MoxR-like ATPase